MLMMVNKLIDKKDICPVGEMSFFSYASKIEFRKTNS